MTEDYEALERKKRELFPTMHGNHFVKEFVLEEKRGQKDECYMGFQGIKLNNGNYLTMTCEFSCLYYAHNQ